MTRLKYAAAITAFALCAGLAAAQPSGNDRYGGPQWPNVALDEPDAGTRGPGAAAYAGPRWPELRLDDVEARRINPNPGFVDPLQVEARIMGRAPAKPAAAPQAQPLADNGHDANASVAARWPTLPPEKPVSAFVFEAGARYWYSSGQMKFGFANGNPLFGNPTSTLDWLDLTAHSGELFGRVDHLPSGMFVKGIAGLGALVGGEIVDRDFLAGQYKFSDTTSSVNDGDLKFAMIDVGWSFSPVGGIKVGFFAGYHYWYEKATAYGLVCNQASVLGCAFPGQALIGGTTAVLEYQPTWHAARLGVTGQFAITERLSFSAELAAIPYAAVRNKDSHLLRQDLGPSPNVIADSQYAVGGEAELMLTYAVTPGIELGVGGRYWGLTARRGEVTFGPAFATNSALNRFDQQRYGLLLQAKGKF